MTVKRYKPHPDGARPEGWPEWYVDEEDYEQLLGTLSLAEEGLANYAQEVEHLRAYQLQMNDILKDNERLRAALQDLANCCGHDDDKALLLALTNAAETLKCSPIPHHQLLDCDMSQW